MRKLVFIAVLALLAGCEHETQGVGVRYMVTSQAERADITITDKYGNSVGYANAVTPWMKSFNGKAGDTVSVTARSGGSQVAVKIYKNGALFKSASAQDIASTIGVL
jgi:hypothetical protein